MSLSLSVKYRNAKSRVSLKDSSTVGALKSEINKTYNIEESQQRIIVDWREITNDALTLSEAGFVKKSKVTVLQKREYSTNPEDITVVHVEYEGETSEYTMNKEQEFTELVCMFFQNHAIPQRVDDVKLKLKGKLIKLDQLIKDVDVTAPVKLTLVERTAKKPKPSEESATPVEAAPKGDAEAPKEVETPKTPKKKEKAPKKEKTPKKEAVRSMSILSFLKQTKKPEPAAAPEPVDEEPVAPAAETPSDPPVDFLASSPSLSVATLRSSFLEAMRRSENEAISRRSLLRERVRRVVSRRETSPSGTTSTAEVSASTAGVSSTHPASSSSSPSSPTLPSNSAIPPPASPTDEIAVIEVANEFEASPVASPTLSSTEPPLLDAAPALFAAPSRPLELTIDKTALTPPELTQLASLLGFRYLEADSDQASRSVFFGVSHKSSEIVTGRRPLARETAVDYDLESESDTAGEEEVPGDDCDDTESETDDADDANRLDYGDGFLEEEDLNIGDGNLTAEEKSALVFRSVSGNKGKLPRETRLPNVPIVVSARNSGEFGVDLQRCRCVISDPVFFERQVEAMRSRPIEFAAGEIEEGVSEPQEKRGSVKRLNMNEEMVQVLSGLIQGQAITITQINDKMQERFPGLPKRQIEAKLHEIAEKKHRVWVLRTAAPETKPNMDSVMASRMTPEKEDVSRKRASLEASEDADIVEIIDARSRSHLEKKIRIQPEKIPNGTILHGNISQSALAFDASENAPSTFVEVKEK